MSIGSEVRLEIHPLMKNAHDQDPVVRRFEEDHVSAAILTPIAGSNARRRAPVRRVGCKHLHRIDETVDVFFGLIDGPLLGRVSPNIFEIPFGARREPVFSHGGVSAGPCPSYGS